jgi:uncharacterized membrane protein
MKTTNNLLRLLSFSSLLTMACGPSLESMHERAAAGQVQDDAPLHARQSITILAPRHEVYALLTDFGGWPRWQPNITKVTPPPEVAPGARFTWVNGSSEISSQIAAVKPDELLAWTGSVSTAKAAHVWRFSSPTPDTTQVDVEETMDGFLLTWFYGQKDLDAEMARSLANLKKAAESAAKEHAAK